MAENLPIKGANRFILMRPYALRHEVEAGRMAFQTTHERSMSRETEATMTKDGNINSLSELKVEYKLTTLMATNDKVRERLYEAFLNGDLVEIWDIDKTVPTEVEGNLYPASYYQGYLTEWNETAGAEDSVEISLSIAINGSGVRGQVTLTGAQAQVVQYEFADTTVVR